MRPSSVGQTIHEAMGHVMRDIHLSVVMPAFNEAALIERTLRETVAALGCVGELEIVVVDDGSVDGTADIAEEFAKDSPVRVRVMRLPRNRGKGYALNAGARLTGGDLVAFLDADLDLHPQQLLDLLDVMSRSGADVVIGSKLHPGSKVKCPPLRRFLSVGYFWMVRALFGLPIHDTQTGIKLFRAHVLDVVVPRLLVRRLAFDLEMLAVANRFGFVIAEAPVELDFQRSVGRINLRDAARVFVDTLAVFYRLKLRRWYDSPRPSSPDTSPANGSLTHARGSNKPMRSPALTTGARADGPPPASTARG